MTLVLLAESWVERNGTLIGVIIGLAGIAIAIVTVRWQRHTKHVDVLLGGEQRLDTPFSRDADADEDDGLSVTYHGRLLNHPVLVTVTIGNTGKSEVRPEDFGEAMKAITVEHASVIAARLAGHSDSLRDKPALMIEEHTCHYEPVLLNAKDWIAVQLLLDIPPVTNWWIEDIAVPIVIAGQTRAAKVLVTSEGKSDKIAADMLADFAGTKLSRRFLGIFFRERSYEEIVDRRNYYT